MLQYPLPLEVRADSLSALQNLGQPLSRVAPVAAPLPEANPIPSVLDASLSILNTRTKKCCKDPRSIDRISSEIYPIHADRLKDLRDTITIFGAPSRFDGRDPFAFRR